VFSASRARVHRFPLEEEVVVGLDVGQVAPEGRADARLTVFLGKRPELVEHEDAVTGRHRRVGLGIEVLTESVQDGVPVHVVRVADVVHPQLPQHLLNRRHLSGLHSW
jgi:hypothetical protein